MNLLAACLAIVVQLAFLAGSLFLFRCYGERTPANRLLRAGGIAALCVDVPALLSMPDGLSWRQWLAVAVLAGSGAVWGWAWRSSRGRPFGVALAPDVPNDLVMHGAFGFVRHPFYVSYFLGWGGIALLVGSVPVVAGSAVMIASYASAAVLEERRLRASPLAAAHAVYRQRVGMFVPRSRCLVDLRCRRDLVGGA